MRDKKNLHRVKEGVTYGRGINIFENDLPKGRFVLRRRNIGNVTALLLQVFLIEMPLGISYGYGSCNATLRWDDIHRKKNSICVLARGNQVISQNFSK